MAETRAAPEERGTLTIDDRVVEKVAAYAAGEVHGTTALGAGWERVLRRRLPKATATVAGGRTRVSVEVATIWPAALAEVAGEVRDTVAARIEDFVGLVVDAVDVTTADVVHQTVPDRRVE